MPVDTSNLSKTEKQYAAPTLVIIHDKNVPIEVMRGLLFFFEGKINCNKDKDEIRRELRRYLKYEGNTEKLVDAIKKTILGEPESNQNISSESMLDSNPVIGKIIDSHD